MFLELNSQAPLFSGSPDPEKLRHQETVGLVSEVDRAHNKTCF